MPQEISAQDLASRIQQGKPLQIIDVREDWERDIAKIPDQLHIPMNTIPQRLGEVKAPPGGEIVVYCHGGVRSMMVAGFLEQNGIPGVLSLAGGIAAWSSDVDPGVPQY
ncbi:MAG TPA: rhodanese-like domain-containing protein [Planctomycetota bacterium]|nr:rhodanese-like domain-containing protein [Planctomycetota bacterium]